MSGLAKPARYSRGSAAHAPVSQHEAGAARTADSVTEVIGGRARISADTHLIEHVCAPGAHQRTQQAWVLITDHRTQPLHRTCIHRQRLVAVEPGGKLNAPQLGGSKPHMLLKSADEGIGRRFEQSHYLAATCAGGAVQHLPLIAGGGPVVDRPAGNGGHVVASLLRHWARTCEP